MSDFAGQSENIHKNSANFKKKERCIIWCWNMDTSASGSEAPGEC
jgi:hypothetical protein